MKVLDFNLSGITRLFRLSFHEYTRLQLVKNNPTVQTFNLSRITQLFRLQLVKNNPTCSEFPSIHESTRLQLVKYNLTVQSFLPCSRKKGLFGHVVTKSHKAWQTMELYPTKISEVHQTYPGYMISIWACRECLGHPISKKNGVKRLFFEWVIPRTSFWLQIATNWLHVDWLDYKWIQINWLQVW